MVHKNKMKTMLNIVIAIIFAITIMFSPMLLSLPFVINSLLAEDPDIVYMEFPIELTYMMNGEVITLNDLFIVEYSGHDPMLGYTYNGYTQSNKDKGPTLYEKDNTKIICGIGSVNYYLRKGRSSDDIVHPTINIYVREEKYSFVFFKNVEYTILTDSELLEQYGISLVSWAIGESIYQ